jgi:hypothetical protein
MMGRDDASAGTALCHRRWWPGRGTCGATAVAVRPRSNFYDLELTSGAAAMPHFGMPRRVVETPVSSKTQVNWKRGFFRVWILASGAWIMSWTLWLMIYGISRGFRDVHEIFAIPVLLFGPPVALMLFGLVAGWAFRGFMPDEDEKK